MRCDLHVHTLHSGPPDLPALRHLSRECYSEPLAVYETAKRRGMDLVTITDHDTIEGALKLAHLPDFIVGEEVTCVLAPGRQIHLGVWDLNESGHAQISMRRRDPESLLAWLAENRIPACINHPFSPLTGAREAEDFRRAFSSLDLIEAHNGMMPGLTNEFARLTGRAHGMAPVGGSDAHTLDQVAHAFTTVPKATNRSEFLEGLRAGFSVLSGGSGKRRPPSALLPGLRSLCRGPARHPSRSPGPPVRGGELPEGVRGRPGAPRSLSGLQRAGPLPRALPWPGPETRDGRREMNAVLAYFDQHDRRVVGRLDSFSPPRWFRARMIAATRLGDGWLWAAVALVLVATGDYGAFLASAFACCAANAAMVVLKKKVRRCRPCRHTQNPFFQKFKADPSAFDGFSFPSGHTTNAFAIGTVLSALHPSLLPATAFVAVSVELRASCCACTSSPTFWPAPSLGTVIGSLVCGLAL